MIAKEIVTEKAALKKAEEPSATAKEEPPVSKRIGIKVNPLVSKALVMINGGQPVGTGFFVREKGGVYFYIAAHVISGNKTFEIILSSGKKYPSFKMIEIAEGFDLARVSVGIEPEYSLTISDGSEISQGLLTDAYGKYYGQIAGSAQSQAIAFNHFEFILYHKDMAKESLHWRGIAVRELNKRMKRIFR